MSAPVVDLASCIRQVSKPVLVQAAVSERSVEALDECILCRLARLDEVQLHATATAPEKHCLTGQFGAVVGHQGLRHAALSAKLLQIAGQPDARDRGIDDLADTLAGVVIDNVEDPEPQTVGQLIAHEIHRPALSWAFGQHYRHPRPYQFLAPLSPHLQSQGRVDPVGPLTVDRQPLRA